MSGSNSKQQGQQNTSERGDVDSELHGHSNMTVIDAKSEMVNISIRIKYEKG